MARYVDGRLKRAIDLLGGAVAALTLAPVLAAVAAVLLVTEGRPVLFGQVRVGRDGREFLLRKFRTMRPPTGSDTDLLSDADRVHALGRFLRRSSLDELPGIWNVLAGHMSLVGPRPLLPLHMPLYVDTHPERLGVRPGITGLAQVRGRQDLTFRARLDADVEYVRSAGLMLDIAIVLRTVRLVLRGGGVRTGQDLAAVDDIGLGARILAAQRREQGSFLQPHGPVGDEDAVGPGGGATGRPAAVDGPLRPPLPQGPARLFGTARQALLALLDPGPAHGPWPGRPAVRRVLLPSYYCEDVAEVLARVLPVVRYPWAPAAADGGPGARATVDAGPDDAVVVLGFLGAPPTASVRGGLLIVDATHSLGTPGAEVDADGRAADWSVASLRKTLPLPDGALLWSPAGRTLPPAPGLVAAHARPADEARDALERKRRYLAGGPGSPASKDAWLADLRRANRAMESSSAVSAALPSTGADLAGLDVAARWDRRAANHAALVGTLRDAGAAAHGVRVLPGTAFAGLVMPDDVTRDAVAAGLVARSVFPAILWPRSGGDGGPGRDLSERSLVLHVDARSSVADASAAGAAVMDALADHAAATGRTRG